MKRELMKYDWERVINVNNLRILRKRGITMAYYHRKERMKWRM
jgi:hypothetical protein